MATEANQPPMRFISKEQFQALLVAIKNGAVERMTTFVVEADDEEVEHYRAVFHAAEVGLGVLNFCKYVPSRGAREDMRTILEWLDEDDDEDE